MSHRFSNRTEVREDILRKVKQPEQHITVKLPVNLYYSLISDIQRAILETLEEIQ